MLRTAPTVSHPDYSLITALEKNHIGERGRNMWISQLWDSFTSCLPGYSQRR